MEKLFTKRSPKTTYAFSTGHIHKSDSSLACHGPPAVCVLHARFPWHGPAGLEGPASVAASPCSSFPEVQMKPFTPVACCLDANGISETRRPLAGTPEDRTRHSLLPSLKGAPS